MRKLILTALILSTVSGAAMSEDMFSSPADLEKMQEIFYEAPATAIPEVEVKYGNMTKPVEGMPLFKKTRIKITNYLRERDYLKQQQLLEQEKEKTIEPKEEVKVSHKKSKKQKSEETLELSGGVKEHVTSNDVQLDADVIEYDNDTADIIATGSPVLYFPPQNTTIKADKMIYNNESNKLKAFGNVEVIRDGNSVFGDYLQINMNEENAFMDNITTETAHMTVTARTSDMDDKMITLYNGKMLSENSFVLNVQTDMIGGTDFSGMVIKDADRSSINDTIGETAVNIKTKELIINAKKDHDNITLKKALVNYGDVTLFNIHSLTAHTNKQHNFFEANYPEFGSQGRLGMFAGPGFVFDTPLQRGSTLKVIPIINNKSGIGFGGMLKYRSATNYTNFAYVTAAEAIVLKGRQNLDDRLYLQYGANSYLDEWFLGARMPKYNVELIYHDQNIVPSTIGENRDLKFRHRFGIGYMQNGEYNTFDENFAKDNIGTMRTRYMAEVSQNLFKLKDKENLKIVELDLNMQGSAAIYGTGDTQFIGRVGPALHSQYKYWMQDIGFYLSAYQDGTPMQLYDSYRYGHGNVYIREGIRLCKYLNLAWAGSFTVTGDSPNGNILQENSFIVGIGPDDFKINIGYDWTRRQTYFALVIAMDTKGSSIEYDKMIIKNPENLSKKEEEVELKVFDNPNNQKQATAKPKKMMYAEVIDIEDPDREQI